MKILAILQNQWFKDPEGARRIYAESNHPRHRLNARFLFRSSKSGRVLKAGFADLCDMIIWEEASPEIGGFSSAKFKPDPKHIAEVIKEHEPTIIITFGRLAQEGEQKARKLLEKKELPKLTIFVPHPASRDKTVVSKYKAIAEELRRILAKECEV